MVGDPDDLHPLLEARGDHRRVVFLLRLICCLLGMPRDVRERVYLERAPVKAGAGWLPHRLGELVRYGAMLQQGRELRVEDFVTATHVRSLPAGHRGTNRELPERTVADCKVAARPANLALIIRLGSIPRARSG